MAHNHIRTPCARCLELLLWSWGHGIPTKAQVLKEQVGVIRKELGKPSPNLGEIGTKLDDIEKVVERIANLTSPFLLEDVPINLVVLKRVGELQEHKEYEAVTFQVDLDPGEPFVRANPVWLRRILDIMADNALDAMRESTERQIGISTAVSERRAEIAVSDTGSGIDGELLSNLLEKPSMFQPGGRGRGLYIAAIVLDIYGGGIQVGNTGPTGTALVAWLPLRE